MIKIILKGRIPSKKNSKIVVCRGSYPLVLSSKAYQNWHTEKMWELKVQRISKIENVGRIEIVIFAPDNRKSDLSNKIESINDLLVDAGILEDDNWFICSEINMKFGGVDKINPRAEIIINEKSNETTIY